MEDNTQNNKNEQGEPDGSSFDSSETAQDSNKELTDLKNQLQKSQNDFLYLKADFENYKKRVLKEQSDLRKYGSEHLVRSLLDLLDNFERALSFDIKPDNLKNFSDGIKMIQSEFQSVLQKYGVSEVDAAGKLFDPNLHEAMGTEPTAKFAPGHISKVFTKPYKLHDRVVRPGRVIIAEEPKQTES